MRLDLNGLSGFKNCEYLSFGNILVATFEGVIWWGPQTAGENLKCKYMWTFFEVLI